MKHTDVTKKFSQSKAAGAVKERPPKPTPPPPPVPPDFEVALAGDPTLQPNGVVSQRVKVFRKGTPKLSYTVDLTYEEGGTRRLMTKPEFAAKLNFVLEDAKAKILAEEALLEQAKALVGG